MLKLDGQNFSEALNRVRPSLTAAARKEATKNASQIIEAVVQTYDTKIKRGEVGRNGRGPSGNIAAGHGGQSTGLVYGRIQSGKTRAMVTSAALAFDNKFQIVVVLTSSNNRLVQQTARYNYSHDCVMQSWPFADRNVSSFLGGVISR